MLSPSISKCAAFPSLFLLWVWLSLERLRQLLEVGYLSSRIWLPLATGKSLHPSIHLLCVVSLILSSYTDENRLGYFFGSGGKPPPVGTLLPSSNSTPGGGITWPRFVSNLSGAKLYNYAVSGAVCDNKQIYRFIESLAIPFPDVVYEVDAFIADSKYKNKTTGTNTLYTNRKSDNTVYSMWIGTNDLGAGAFLTDNSLNGVTIPDYVDCIFEKFDRIYKAGGRYFVLMNTAPLELSPLYGKVAAGGLSASKYWTDKVLFFPSLYTTDTVIFPT